MKAKTNRFYARKCSPKEMVKSIRKATIVLNEFLNLWCSLATSVGKCWTV